MKKYFVFKKHNASKYRYIFEVDSEIPGDWPNFDHDYTLTQEKITVTNMISSCNIKSNKKNPKPLGKWTKWFRSCITKTICVLCYGSSNCT